MPKHGKRYRADLEKVPAGPVPLQEAVNRVKTFKPAKFDQSIEIAVTLGIDPRQADQAVRGSVSLPHGIGKARRVIAFCDETQAAAAKEAGAMEAGSDELVAKIEGGWMDFDIAIASPDMMRNVAKLGRTLGPKGLMPSPKSGTVVQDVPQAVREFAAGKVEFRNDKLGNVHAIIGKLSFEADKLYDNAKAFIDELNRMKPSAAKGQYMKQAALSGTMTPGVPVDVA